MIFCFTDNVKMLNSKTCEARMNYYDAHIKKKFNDSFAVGASTMHERLERYEKCFECRGEKPDIKRKIRSGPREHKVCAACQKVGYIFKHGLCWHCYKRNAKPLVQIVKGTGAKGEPVEIWKVAADISRLTQLDSVGSAIASNGAA